MDATGNTGKAKTTKQATGTNDDTVMAASSRPFGPDGATILAGDRDDPPAGHAQRSADMAALPGHHADHRGDRGRRRRDRYRRAGGAGRRGPDRRRRGRRSGRIPGLTDRFGNSRFATTVLGVTRLAAPQLLVLLEATAVD